MCGGLLSPVRPALYAKKQGPEGPCKFEAYLPLRPLPSSVSGGRTTNLPSTAKALSSVENPIPSLRGKAAPMRVHFYWVLPLLSYSSTVKTLR